MPSWTAAEARPKAKTAAEQAIAARRQLRRGARLAGQLQPLFYEYDWAGCERDFRRAFALNPNYAFAHDQFGLALAFQGRLDEAIAEGRRAAALDPLSPEIAINNTIAFTFQGSFQAAKDQSRRAAELDPAFFFPPFADGWVDIEAGRPRDAIPALKKAQAMDAPAFVTAWLAYAYGASGERSQAMSELETLRRVSLRGQVLPFNLAIVYLGLGDHARVLDNLERAYAANSQWMGWLAEDRIFDPLRAEAALPGADEQAAIQPVTSGHMAAGLSAC